LQCEPLLLAASLKANAPTFVGTLYVAEPQAGPLWPKDPTMPGGIKGELEAVDAVILPFVNEALARNNATATKSKRFAPCQRVTISFFGHRHPDRRRYCGAVHRFHAAKRIHAAHRNVARRRTVLARLRRHMKIIL
jgi:hypothetical protein